MKSPLKFTGVVGAEQIKMLWPHVVPYLSRAINRYGEHSLEEIFSSLLSKERQMWVPGNKKVEGVLITKIINREDEKICFLELCAGRGIESIRFLHLIEKWAKNAGCTRMELSGREGWKRVLKNYKIKKIILEKEL